MKLNKNIFPQVSSSRSVFMRDIKSFLLRPILRTETLRNDGAAATTRGFTLIELLVVVLIIGILAAIALPQYQKAVDKSRMTQALIWAKSIAEAERIYHLANGKYTQNLEELDIAFPGCVQDSAITSYYNCEDGWSIRLTENNTAYILLPTKWLPAGTTAAIEYYYDYNSYFKDYVRLCYASSDRFRNVCKNMGGVKHSGTDYFRL